MFLLPYKPPNIVERTFAKPLILYYFLAFHLAPWPLDLWNPLKIINSFGDDPYIFYSGIGWVKLLRIFSSEHRLHRGQGLIAQGSGIW